MTPDPTTAPHPPGPDDAPAGRGTFEGRGTFGDRARAYAVHGLTASGVVFVFLAAAEACRATPDPRWAFVWLAGQVGVDAIDGPFARRWQVKRFAPHIDGRTIDDVVDYLSYTFVPLLLVWRLGWAGDAGGVLAAAAMVVSLFGFANTGAKDEARGFFLGFPSYWNVVAFYAGLTHACCGPVPGAVLIAACTGLTVCPVRFLYPNLAPRPWRLPVLIGAAVWLGQFVLMLPAYPNPPAWMLWASLAYPAFYTALSVWLDRRSAPPVPAPGMAGRASQDGPTICHGPDA